MSMRQVREENLGELVRVGVGPRDAMDLQKISRRLHRRDEFACSYELGDGTEAAYEKYGQMTEAIERKAQKIAERYGFIAYHQSDCGGWALYLVKPEQLGEYQIDSVYDRGISVCPH